MKPEPPARPARDGKPTFHLRLLAVVPGIKASGIELLVDPDPVGPFDSPAVLAGGTLRKGAGDFDPPLLLLSDRSNLVGDFGEILILAHDERYVVCATMSE